MIQDKIFEQENWLIQPLGHRLDMLQYEYVRDGDMRAVELAGKIFRRPDHGKMSEDPLRNMIYHFICAAVLVTRYAIDGGLDKEEAMSLSDVLIQRADAVGSIEDIYQLVDEMYSTFTERVIRTKRQNAGTLPIQRAKAFIFAHLHERITTTQVAEAAGVTPNYLSSLFKKETGQALSGFIRQQRLEAARLMLAQSERPISEIAATLPFASESHFIQAFRSRYGVTPAIYRSSLRAEGIEAKDEIDETFTRREEGLEHLDTQLDMLQYEYVRKGDLRSVDLGLEIFKSPYQGRLSADPLRNVIYRFVCATMLVTRFSLDGGLGMDVAYPLSDHMIRCADQIRGIDEIYPLVEELFRSFTQLVARAKKQTAGSLPVRRAKEYIFAHLNEKITVSQLAEAVELTPNYLSMLFHQETGQSLSEYIRAQRLLYAENLLLYSSMPISQIAEMLGFSSDSHFIRIFREEYGMPPAVYRRQKASWSVTKNLQWPK
ncbi:MAG: helix-turn-helix domain-containing protein [Firmicutes bacterium]|nr:helix-turn-helix domain-containing protein [Bacillota bacterium]